MFQQVLNSLGQMDKSGQYNLKTTVLAIIKEAKKVEYSQSTGKPYQRVFLEAANGETAWVKLTGTFDPIDDNYYEKRYEFLVWPFKGQQAPKPSLYAWIQKQVAPQPQQRTQSQQAPPQTTNTNGIGKDVRARAMDVAARLNAANVIRFCDLYSTADDVADYIANGNHPLVPAGVADPDFPQEP